MTFEEFEIALGRRGPDLASWPAAERARAEALLASGPEARRALVASAALEAAFAEARARPGPAPAALLERVIADAAEVAASREPAPGRSPSRPRWRLPEFFRPVLACAASAVLGLWLGQSAMVAQAAEGLLSDPSDAVVASLDGAEFAMGYDELPEIWE